MLEILLLPVLYYLYFQLSRVRAFRNYVPAVQTRKKYFFSVIVPFRNEAENLRELISSLKKIRYEPFEVLLVDDHSEDGSAETVEKAVQGKENFRLLHLPETLQGKKSALAYGISRSRGEIILTTDADCKVPPTWITEINKYFTENTGVVLGAVKIEPRNLPEELEAIELAGLIVLAGGGVARRTPDLANGANFAYRKKVFEEVRGFQGIDNVASGDDELFLQKVLRETNYEIQFAKNKDAVVATKGIPELRGLIQQRIRWAGKTRLYPLKQKINVLLIMLAYFSLIVFLFADGKLFVIAFAMKTLSDFILTFTGAKFTGTRIRIFSLLTLTLCYVPFVLFIGTLATFQKKYIWKARKTR